MLLWKALNPRILKFAGPDGPWSLPRDMVYWYCLQEMEPLLKSQIVTETRYT